ncbi:MAG: lactate utilization protein C [Burkholderiales bacterium]|nr:lactate utilization protein C [Burkholderiales bacterium]
MSAREAILQRIRSAQAHAVVPEVERIIANPVRGPQPAPVADLVSRFIEQAQALSSQVLRVDARNEIPHTVAHYLAENSLGNHALCWPDFLELDWIAARIVVAAQPTSADDAVGITGAFCAIAETGTLMLLSGAHTPAATSLLPETHIAVLDSARIVATMEDAWDLLRRERGGLPRAVNFVSGPSRTADIEQTVTLGAHGPARVLIVLVG